MTNQDPGRQATQDQLDAAYAQAVAASTRGAMAVSPLVVGTIIPSAGKLKDISKSASKILDQYIAYVSGERPVTCEHNPVERGPVAIWCPGIDGIYCPQCALPVIMEMSGTDWDTTCDLCGKVHPKGATMSQESLTIEGTIGQAGTIYPTQLLYAYCLDCKALPGGTATA